MVVTHQRTRVGVAGLGLAFVLAIALGATGVLAPKHQRVALGASTTLTIISGTVSVRHGAEDFALATDGAVLGPGDTVRTDVDARAVLTYFEGSTVEIEPSSELTIDTAHGNPDGSTVIVMKQELGTTWHVVTHLVQGGSKYEVHTTSSTASVRGTAFTVGVAPDGTTTETTTEGAVANSDAQGVATVVTMPGLQTTTTRGHAPTAPVPAPEAERKVTVTVGDQNALVVDTLGRANGIKDGTKVLQTPGAQLRIVDGHLVVTLPNIPDGTVATHFLAPSGETDVTTKVEVKGRSAVEVTDTVKSGANVGVSIKTGTGKTPSIEKKTGRKGLPAPKIGRPPAAPSDQQKESDDADADKDKQDDVTGTTAGGLTNSTRAGGAKHGPQLPTGGFVPDVTVPTVPKPVKKPAAPAAPAVPALPGVPGNDKPAVPAVPAAPAIPGGA